MELRQKLFIGCLGALTPILANLFVVDLQIIIPKLLAIEALTYAVKLFALCAAACIVVYLNSDEKKPIKLFQLGIVAPALITSMLNGAALENKTKNTPTGTTDQRVLFEMPSIVGSAFAQGPATRLGDGQILDCLKPQDPTVTQQILKGLVGIVAVNQWFVVVGSFSRVEGAIADASAINQRFAGKYEAKVCGPPAGTDPPNYRIVIGQYLTYVEASKLKEEAINAGLPSESWVWNPFQKREVR